MNNFKSGNKIIFIIILALISISLYSQNNSIDSLQYKKVAIDTVKLHSPKTAAMYSAILPGLGQAYNKKYWKIPLVYAGFGTIGYFIGWNNRNYKTYKIAYSDFTDTIPQTNSYLKIIPPGYDLENSTHKQNFKTGLYRQQEYFRRNRDLLIISMIGFYGLNIIDASVDAHFFDFDISDDLSMNWQPAVQPYRNELIYGLYFTFNF